MSSSLREKLENIQQLLERLAKESAQGVPIIVEGQNDVATLHKLSIEGDIISAKSAGKSLIDILREAEHRQTNEIILLLDFDRRGIEYTHCITRRLERRRIKANTFYWKRLKAMVGRDVKDIEGLATYLETLTKKCGR